MSSQTPENTHAVVQVANLSSLSFVAPRAGLFETTTQGINPLTSIENSMLAIEQYFLLEISHNTWMARVREACAPIVQSCMNAPASSSSSSQPSLFSGGAAPAPAGNVARIVPDATWWLSSPPASFGRAQTSFGGASFNRSGAYSLLRTDAASKLLALVKRIVQTTCLELSNQIKRILQENEIESFFKSEYDALVAEMLKSIEQTYKAKILVMLDTYFQVMLVVAWDSSDESFASRNVNIGDGIGKIWGTITRHAHVYIVNSLWAMGNEVAKFLCAHLQAASSSSQQPTVFV